MNVYTFLENFIKIGTLTVTDAQGKTYKFSGTPFPDIAIRFSSKAFERRLLHSPHFALGEGYVNGDLIVEKGDVFDFLMLCASNLSSPTLSSFQNFFFRIGRYFLHARNCLTKSRDNVAHHYDLSGALYRLFLDKDMQYSCAYFRNLEDDLDTAQENKKRHLAAKLQIKPGHKILDIGCGWGGLALSLARQANVHVVGLTLSKEQHRVATERAKEAGLEDKVEFRLQDYRHETETYDRIISVGMFEHVGLKNYGEFFNKVHSLLKPHGLAVLHSIGCATGPDTPNPWINKYIFPGGYCPALSETMGALETANLYATDIEILHQHYAETLRHWRHRFLNQREKVLVAWGPRFLRMWEFYLASCEVAFRKRGFMVFQIQMVRDPAYASLTRDYIRDEERKFRGHLVPLRKKKEAPEQQTVLS